MSEFVKKSMIGYKEVSDGLDDPECSHVILTKHEYNDLQHDLLVAKNQVIETQYNAESEIKRIQDKSANEIHKIEAETKKKIAEIEKKLVLEQQESELQRGLNANLIRISKERANAERNLRPKKKHTGYVVVSSAEKEYRYKDGSRRWCSIMLWETVLQTPYIVDFTVPEVQNLIQELFQDQEDGQWIINKIGITGYYEHGYADLIYDREWKSDYQAYNIMFEHRLKANYRTGFWEIIFYHTKPLECVPSDMKAR